MLRCERAPVRTLCLALFLTSASPAAAEILAGEGYQDKELGLTLPVPEGWRVSHHTGYPSLRIALHRTDGKVSVWLSVFPARKNLKAIVAANNAVLPAVGLRVFVARSAKVHDLPAWKVSAETANAEVQVRQIYLARRRQAVVFTLRCRTADLREVEPDLERIVGSLELAP